MKSNDNKDNKRKVAGIINITDSALPVNMGIMMIIMLLVKITLIMMMH